MRSRVRGFSLLELLVVVAIIGVLVGIALPLLMDALDKSKQRATVAEMRLWGTALSAYAAEKSIFPGVAGQQNASSIHNDLVPYAVSVIHDNDAWTNPLQYYTDISSSYTIQGCGKDGFTPANCADLTVSPCLGCVTPATWQFFNLDIVLTDGIFTYSPS